MINKVLMCCPKILSSVALSVFVVSCGSLAQKELTFNAPLTAEQRQKNSGYNSQLRKQIEREEEDAYRLKLSHEVISDFEFGNVVSTGFIGTSKAFYSVNRDGTAALISKQGVVTELDQLVQLVDEVTTGGPEGERLVGLAAHGSLAAWNVKDLSQQVVLRAQQTTFKKVKLFDAQIVSNGRRLITLSEGQKIETWDLKSGRLLKETDLGDIQPRVITRNIQKNRYIIGGNRGEVFLWAGNKKVVPLYNHAGPILNLLYIPKFDLIASTSKDGRLQIYSFQENRVIFSRQFSSANYSLYLSQDQRFLISSPSSGVGISVDFSELEHDDVVIAKPLLPAAFKAFSGVGFAPDGRFAISKHVGLGLMLWDFQLLLPSRGALKPKADGAALDFRIADKTNVAAVLTDENFIEYWDIEKAKYLGPALQVSGMDIVDFKITKDGKWLLAILSDGRAVRQKISLGETKPIRVQGL